MAGTGNADRATENNSFSEPATTDFQQVAKVAAVAVDLRDGFRNEPRTSEYRAIHGLSADADDTHEDWVARLHPEDRDRTVRKFMDAVNGTGEHISSQYRIIRPNDGQVRWIATEARIERDAGGAPLRLVGAHIDITDLAVAKETLRESEERFRLIANSAPVPMWVTKIDRTRAFANQAYLEFLGVPYEEGLAFDWRTILHPDDVQRIVKESVAGEATLKPFVLEGRYRRADGQWRWMRSESQPRWDPTGKHIGFIGVAHDVTAAKEAEIELRNLNETLEQRIEKRTSQLRSNEAQMRSIFETSNQYQAVLDLKGNVVHANATALAGIRATAQDVRGKLFWDSPWFSGTEGMREFVANAFDAVVKGESVRTEMRLNLPTGERFFDFTMRPVFNQHGAVSGVLPEAVDITERRQAEEALRQSQKMDAIGQLTGGVAHDFNNLLTVILGNLDKLAQHLPAEQPRWRRWVDQALAASERAANLTQQLLAFSRRQPLKPKPVAINQLVDHWSELIRRTLPESIVIRRIEDADVGSAEVDANQLESALLNLAINAKDAMPSGGTLTIETASTQVQETDARLMELKPGDYIVLCMTDTGVGMSAEVLQRAFDPFFTTKPLGQGTGLGLSQVFGFVKQSEGHIKLYSRAGHGTTVKIYLPKLDGSAEGQVEGAADTRQVGRVRRETILVVEDNDAVRLFTTDTLRDLGFDVIEAVDAAEALKVLDQNKRVDLMFTDIGLPGLNGRELAATVQRRHPKVRTLFTSGYAQMPSPTGSASTGDIPLLSKPFTRAQLYARVCEVLDA
jgi:PAS domain S-box-containing protein